MSGEALLVLLSVAALEALLPGDNALVGWAGARIFREGKATLARPMHPPGLAGYLPELAFGGVTFPILLWGSLFATREHAQGLG